jgi:Fic family protein
MGLLDMFTPKYLITNKILKNIGTIEAAKEVIESAPLVPYYEKQFKSDALIRTVHHGTHIEGNDLDIDQTKRILEGQDVFGKERDVKEVVNYRNVVKLLDELAVKRGGYDIGMLEDIHKETVRDLISPEKIGVLRTTQVLIKEEGTGEIILEPPSAAEVPYLLDDFFEWLNSNDSQEIHPIIRAGITHYILVSIHPFVEGNGRTIRAFSTLILLREGYDIKRFFALEEYFDKDLSSYYEAFSFVDKQSNNLALRDLTPWLEYFTEVVAAELSQIKEHVRKLSIDSKLRLKLGQQIALTERQMKIIEYLSENGSAAMTDLRSLLSMVSEDTILRDVSYLMDKGIIKKEGKTKASRYLISTKGE